MYDFYTTVVLRSIPHDNGLLLIAWANLCCKLLTNDPCYFQNSHIIFGTQYV